MLHLITFLNYAKLWESYHVFTQFFGTLYVATPFWICHVHGHYSVIVVGVHNIFPVRSVINLNQWNLASEFVLNYDFSLSSRTKPRTFVFLTLKYSWRNWSMIFSASGWQFSIFICVGGSREVVVTSSSAPSKPIIFGKSFPS